MPRAAFLRQLATFAAIAYGFTWLVMSMSSNEGLAAIGPTVGALALLLATRGGDRVDFAAWRQSLWRWRRAGSTSPACGTAR